MYTDSLTYGTGSEVSTASGRRTLSYASSIGGTINGHAESIAEEDEDAEAEAQQSAGEETETHALTLAQPADAHAKPTSSEHGSVDADTVQDPAEIELEHEQLDELHELIPPPVFTDAAGVGGTMKYGSDIHGSDSGLGTEPPTATEERPHLGEAAEYFAMSAAEQAVGGK
jgi:hypothetical protein